MQNFTSREPESGRRSNGQIYGQWLNEEEEHSEIPTVAGRPWEAAFDHCAAQSALGGLIH